ncbi:MAG: hypothetical protein KDD38_00250 [Bdellovibrionales bacterium]|nr:hypothetical protein [Bdellovibrionales bacterium]
MKINFYRITTALLVIFALNWSGTAQARSQDGYAAALKALYPPGLPTAVRMLRLNRVLDRTDLNFTSLEIILLKNVIAGIDAKFNTAGAGVRTFFDIEYEKQKLIDKLDAKNIRFATTQSQKQIELSEIVAKTESALIKAQDIYKVMLDNNFELLPLDFLTAAYILDGLKFTPIDEENAVPSNERMLKEAFWTVALFNFDVKKKQKKTTCEHLLRKTAKVVSIR